MPDHPMDPELDAHYEGLGALVETAGPPKVNVPEASDLERLDPSKVCLDIVLSWAENIGTPGTAKVMGFTLILYAVNHRKQKVMLNVPLSDEPPRIGRDPRWNLVQLGPTVWKLTPSILDERIHGYVTLVNVPEPAPWTSR